MFQFFTIFIILINNVLSQFYYKPSESDCTKFCFMDCEQYRSRSGQRFWSLWDRYNSQTFNDYNRCRAANYGCRCEFRPTFKNPLILVCTIIVGIGVIVILCYIYGKFKLYIMHRNFNNILSSRSPQSIFPSVNTMPPAVTNYETSTTSIEQSNFDVPTPTHRLSDLPPKYMPPPSYYECTKSKNSNNDISSPKIVPGRSSLKE